MAEVSEVFQHSECPSDVPARGGKPRLGDRYEAFLETRRLMRDLHLRGLVRAFEHSVETVRPQEPFASKRAQILHVEADLLELQVCLGVIFDDERAHRVVGGRGDGFNGMVQARCESPAQLPVDGVPEPCAGQRCEGFLEYLRRPIPRR